MGQDATRKVDHGNVAKVEVSLSSLRKKHLSLLFSRGKMDRSGADLLGKLLILDPMRRMTADEALDHPWFWIAPLPADVKK